MTIEIFLSLKPNTLSSLDYWFKIDHHKLLFILINNILNIKLNLLINLSVSNPNK